jgi:hypothetical protein
MSNDNGTKQPLAEVFGYPINDFSQAAKRHRLKRLCPFNNKVPNCTKDKAKNPLGVCSVFEEKEIAITCPIRFRESWLIADDAAEFFFPPEAIWTTLAEVRLHDQDGKSAGNIDIVLVAYDAGGRVHDFGALEIQAVYISGNVRNPFEHYMQNPAKHAQMNWRDEENYPRPDYLSSSRKRLAPQLIFKGGILHAWGKKTAVALNRGFFNTLPKLPEVPKAEADVAWMIYDAARYRVGGDHADRQLNLVKNRIVYSRWPAFLRPGPNVIGEDLGGFVRRLDSMLDEVVV